MISLRWRWGLLGLAVVVVAALVVALGQLPAAGANGLLHGAADTHTPPDHSRRVLAALAGPSRVILVEGARHNESLRAEVWDEVERWIEDVLKGMIG